MINEVDYDNPGTDTAEFLELYNPGTTSFSLSNVSVVLVNGANSSSYLTTSLASLTSLAPGEYVVMGTTPVVSALPPAVRSLTFSMASDNIQNGAPDGVAVVSGATTVLDSLSWEGATTWDAGTISIPLQEGAASTAMLADSATDGGSIARVPNGSDTNVNATDFVFVGTPTPGARNP